ncbi:MAG TPA: small ribosomal subunit Rsm22 family protein [Chloroflexota bacterium]|nr:small ribosomal subunit Rsm22 family protein [Chloroflexota bacterium]
MLVPMPVELQTALEDHLAGKSLRQIGQATRDLSERYRSGARPGAPIARSGEDVLAYAAYRLPATYAATVAALSALREQRPEWSPRTMLDLGAGPGAGLWAAVSVWPEIQQITAVDAQPAMLILGRQLAAASPDPAVRSAEWIAGNALTVPLSRRYDLVLISYVLSELSPAKVAELVDRAWAATEGALVVVEPGTPSGFARVVEAQERLAASGGHVIAPCPHTPPCTVGEGDWLHFSVRLPRGEVHRLVKSSALGYEDEKFSYVVVARWPLEHPYARITRHPQIRPGNVSLQLCTPAGPKTVVVSKKDGELFKRARKAAWGDLFALPDQAG